jgi:adenylate cyclase
MSVRITIGVKILTVALSLLVLMALVAFLTTHLARDVGTLLHYVVENYVPGYGAIARANVRSVEQALYLRRLIIASLRDEQEETRAEDPSAGRAPTERAFELFMRKGWETDAELAEARTQLAEQLQVGDNFMDVAALSRLDTRLELMVQDRRQYEDLVQSVLAALEQKDYGEFWRQLALVEAQRDLFNEKLDGARREMLRLVQDAAHLTRRRQAEVIRVSMVLLVIGGVLGLVGAGIITRSLVRPVRRLLSGALAVQAGALDTTIPITSRDEIGGLTHAFNHMVAELRVKARIRETFGKYIDPRIVEDLIDRPELTGVGGERQVMTVFFCDITGFTAISEGLTPRGLVNVINRYLTTMSVPIRQHRGIIDKYIGDAIMAFWGPPFSGEEDHAYLACLAALDQVTRLATFQQELPELMGIRRGLPDISVRVGIATGDVVVGNIGSDIMRSYTVMGDVVNLASRLEGVNKAYRTRMLINETAAQRTTGTIETREIDAILVIGQTEPQRVFEILGRTGEVNDVALALRDRFVAGLAAYRRQAWPEAAMAFDACLDLVPDDGPSSVFRGRVAHLMEHPPGPSWNGVWPMTEK